MNKNGRWISRELKHLREHMQMLKTDINSGNAASAKTNWGMAMGIVNAMVAKDRQSTRSIERMGKTIGVIGKHLKPLIKEVAKEAIKAYIKSEK